MRSIEQEIEESLRSVFEATREWSDSLYVERGVLFDPVSLESMDGTPDYLLRMAVSDYSIPEGAPHGNANRYPGLFSVSEKVLYLTDLLNQAKGRLEELVKQAEREGNSRADMRGIYRKAGAPRLHPKHAWRKMVILDPSDLQSIGFTLAKQGSATEIIESSVAAERLAKNNAFDLVDRLKESGADRVRWSEPVAPHIRANVVWGSKESRRSQMLHASLPFLIPAGTWPEKRVRFNYPRVHARRSDQASGHHIPLPFREGAALTILANTA